MLTDVILNYHDEEPIESYYAGRKLEEKFELPNNILIFMHDHYTDKVFLHGRYVLILPAVSIEYYFASRSNTLCIQPGQAALFPPYQAQNLLKTHSDSAHGYSRLFITFELRKQQTYLPDSILVEVNEKSELFLKEVLCAYREKRTADLAILLYFLLRELSLNQEQYQQDHYSPEVKETLSFIHKHIGRQFSLEDLAENARISLSTLRLHFKKETGSTIGGYISTQKLEVAKSYLQQSNISLSELAKLCGFQSIYAFSHFFKRNTGVSPLNWKKRHCSIKYPLQE